MPMTEKGKVAALEALAKRRENPPKRINNADLHAGSPMYFYCKSCGWLAASLPESFTCDVPQLCDECSAMRELGWLE